MHLPRPEQAPRGAAPAQPLRSTIAAVRRRPPRGHWRIAASDGRRLSEAAGWLAVTAGAVHTALAPVLRRDVWSQHPPARLWNSVTLEPSADELPRAEAFWLSVGSFGLPLHLLGWQILASVRSGQPVPASTGWGLLAWGAVATTLLPKSPAWTFPVIGGLIIAGNRSARGAGDPPLG
ncbi:DUF6463 family protein [Tomitella fengzijianii]|uniref:DUF6463 family protein n=1 Tax=Tomitella fengzijianii TaxID=2597660 RepID=UPI0022A8AD64|nr:DUF6463 family protein [Tomitella fengzijianii]